MENEKEKRELLEIELLNSLDKLLSKEVLYSIKPGENNNDFSSNEESRKVTYSLLERASKERNYKETEQLIKDIELRLVSFEANNIKSYFEQNHDMLKLFEDDINTFINKIDERLASYNSVESNNNETEDDEVTGDVKEMIRISEESDEDASTANHILEYVDNEIKNIEKEVESEKDYAYFTDEKNTFEPTTEQDINNLFNPEGKPSESNDLEDELRNVSMEKLTREEIDGFIKKIDDKLAELEAEEKALNLTKFDLPSEKK